MNFKKTHFVFLLLTLLLEQKARFNEARMRLKREVQGVRPFVRDEISNYNIIIQLEHKFKILAPRYFCCLLQHRRRRCKMSATLKMNF